MYLVKSGYDLMIQKLVKLGDQLLLLDRYSRKHARFRQLPGWHAYIHLVNFPECSH
jgi:hypothetical protein